MTPFYSNFFLSKLVEKRRKSLINPILVKSLSQQVGEKKKVHCRAQNNSILFNNKRGTQRQIEWRCSQWSMVAKSNEVNLYIWRPDHFWWPRENSQFNFGNHKQAYREMVCKSTHQSCDILIDSVGLLQACVKSFWEEKAMLKLVLFLFELLIAFSKEQVLIEKHKLTG